MRVSNKVVASIVVCAVLVLLLGALPALAGDLAGQVKGAAKSPAVVYLVGVEGKLPPASDTVITHVVGGAITPAVSLGFVGGEFVFRNEDKDLHTTHLYMALEYQKELSQRPLEEGATIYNIALPMPGMEVRRPIREYHAFTEETGFMMVRCNPHPAEHGAVLVFDHPYAALTGADGKFKLANVPAGRHDLWVWQGGKVKKWQAVDGGRSRTDLVIDLGE